MWLLVQCKVLTTDKLIARNLPCNSVCSVCDQVPETAKHMSLHCVYAQEVWLLVSHWTYGHVKVPTPAMSIEEWWNSSIRGRGKKEKQLIASLIIYTAWNIWKKRN